MAGKPQQKTATLVRRRLYKQALILQAVNAGISQATLARESGLSKYSVFRAYRKCLRQGLIRVKVPTRPIIYGLTPEGKQLMQIFKTSLKNETFQPVFRHDHVFFKSVFRHKPKNLVPQGAITSKRDRKRFSKLQDRMAKEGFVFSPRRNFVGWQCMGDKATVFISPESVWFLVKPVWAESILVAVNESLTIALELRAEVQRAFGCRLGYPERVLEMKRQELAMLGGLTEFFPRGYFKQGDRIKIDCSRGVPEIEAVHKAHAIEDMDRIYCVQDGIARGKFSMEDWEATKADLQELRKVVADLAPVVKEMAPAVREISDVLRKPPERKDLRGYS